MASEMASEAVDSSFGKFLREDVSSVIDDLESQDKEVKHASTQFNTYDVDCLFGNDTATIFFGRATMLKVGPECQLRKHDIDHLNKPPKQVKQ